jgi:hypothetical protein
MVSVEQKAYKAPVMEYVCGEHRQVLFRYF